MADFIQVAKWLDEGRMVKRKFSVVTRLKLTKSTFLMFQVMKEEGVWIDLPDFLTTTDILATDWEVTT